SGGTAAGAGAASGWGADVPKAAKGFSGAASGWGAGCWGTASGWGAGCWGSGAPEALGVLLFSSMVFDLSGLRAR
ncbi:hypothetical protein DX904_10685, partial [Adlercreutzia equolifaciens subsp. celatus]